MKYIKTYDRINEMKLTPLSLINQIVDPTFIKTGVQYEETLFLQREEYFKTLSTEEAENIAELLSGGDLIKMSKATGTPNEILIKSSKWLCDVKKELEQTLDCRKLVLSNTSYKNLSTYKAPKDIRVDVLRTLPNRKDIIQLTPSRVIKYIKTNTLLSVQTYWEYGPGGNNVENYFFCVDLATGLSTYNNYNAGILNNNKISKEELFKYEGMVEKYFAEYMLFQFKPW